MIGVLHSDVPGKDCLCVLSHDHLFFMKLSWEAGNVGLIILWLKREVSHFLGDCSNHKAIV